MYNFDKYSEPPLGAVLMHDTFATYNIPCGGPKICTICNWNRYHDRAKCMVCGREFTPQTEHKKRMHRIGKPTSCWRNACNHMAKTRKGKHNLKGKWS